MRSVPFYLIAASVLALTACSDPLAELPRLSETEMADELPRAEMQADPNAPTVDAVAETTPVPEEAAAPRGGLLGFFQRRADAAKAEDDTEVADAAEPAAARTPATGDDTPEASVDETVAENTGGGGLFGGMLTRAAAGGGGASGSSGRGPAPGAPDYEQVGPGVTLPYGKIARLCGVPLRSLGTRIMRYPDSGRARYALYDSTPNSTSQRNFYLTGFDDGCARQFTAALVLFGDPEIYEQIRYGPASGSQPVSETDEAYERLKSRVCRVRKGQPCGARINRMSSSTVFVSIYERFGSTPRWKNLLVHDGEVLALDIKTK
ncbi:hypothetical protein [Cognatishimia sp. F0-27]|uniref:hypothetical protein n=1 Tax=Cognatishimia sp. F0-27 TaxID=2816855 RepID=UPI001D0C1B99|nr:hypothetical protein [Cognatishimia sp. F0-27]MCC1493933.1 hypothetical protein [Cognatishimia sp. F0-27]